MTLHVSQATNEGIVETDKTPPQTVTVPMPKTDTAAREILERFENGARKIRGDEQVSDSVAQHALEDETSLLQEQWLGNDDEELQSFVDSINEIDCTNQWLEDM